jgi:hypothetical protein
MTIKITQKKGKDEFFISGLTHADIELILFGIKESKVITIQKLRSIIKLEWCRLGQWCLGWEKTLKS